MKTPKIVVLATVTTCAALGIVAIRSNGQAAPPSWGVSSQGLETSLALTQTDQIGGPQFDLVLRNSGSQNVIVNFGYAAPSLPGRIPPNLQLTLTDTKGKALRLWPASGNWAGAVREYRVQLGPGATQKFQCRLDQFFSPDLKASALVLPAGEYQIQAHLAGDAANLRGGKQVANSSWKVALSSNVLKIKLQPSVVANQ